MRPSTAISPLMNFSANSDATSGVGWIVLFANREDIRHYAVDEKADELRTDLSNNDDVTGRRRAWCSAKSNG